MQDGAVTLDVTAPGIDASGPCSLRGRLGFGQLLPNPKSHPRALFLTGVVNVVQANGLAVLLELVFDFAGKCQRRRARQIDAGVLEILAVIETNRDEAAGFGMTFLAGPLQHRDGANLWRVLTGLGYLAGILRANRKRGKERYPSRQTPQNPQNTSSAQ